MTTITIHRALLRQALGALEAMKAEFRALDLPYGSKAYTQGNAASHALRAVLAQEQAEHTDSKYDVEVLREQIRHLEQRIRQLTQDQSAHGKEQSPLICVGSDGDLTVYGPVCSRHDYLINITTTTTTTNL